MPLPPPPPPPSPLLSVLLLLTIVLPPSTALSSASIKAKPTLPTPTTCANAKASPLRPFAGRKAVIVGSGPAGLASALVLSRRHGMDVSVLESDGDPATMVPADASSDDGAASTVVEAGVAGARYDVGRAFLYLIDGRGQSFTSQFPRLHSALTRHGVGMQDYVLQIIPAAADEVLPAEKSLPVNLLGKTPAYWIPRNEFVGMLADEVIAGEEERRRVREEGDVSTETEERRAWGSVTLVGATECTDVLLPEEGGERVLVRASAAAADGGRMELVLEADLVVGADGLRSAVRSALERADPDEGGRFVMRERGSVAAGLRYKVLQLPPRFPIPLGDGGTVPSAGSTSYAVRSVNVGSTDRMSLGLLPLRSDKAARTANCITKSDHVLWTMKTGEEVREWFRESFPRMPFQKEGDGGIVSDEEWERFALSEGGRFPAPQRCEGMARSTEDGAGGVALVGDAVHAFPPDVGQGVNSALNDVLALDAALSTEAKRAGASEEDARLGSALASYERTRSPEVSSLIRLCASSNPLQYNQPGWAEAFRKKLWTANFLTRLLLNKLTFGLVPNHSFLLIQNEKLSYRQITRKSDAVTASLILSLLLGLWKIAAKVVSTLSSL